MADDQRYLFSFEPDFAEYHVRRDNSVKNSKLFRRVMAIIEKKNKPHTSIITNVDKDIEKLEASHVAGWNVKWHVLFKKAGKAPQNVKHRYHMTQQFYS